MPDDPRRAAKPARPADDDIDDQAYGVLKDADAKAPPPPPDDEPEVLDEEDHRPRKKKKKKKRREEKSALPPGYEAGDRILDRKDPELTQHEKYIEWGIPIAIGAFGLLLTLAAAIGVAAGNKTSAVNVGIMFVATIVYTIIVIPVIIAGLIVVGGLMGIEYGTVTQTVRNLSAIILLSNGIFWVGDWAGIFGMFAAPAVAALATFVLFMTLFKLDASETWISVMAVNGAMWVAKMIFFVAIIGMLVANGARNKKAANGGGFDPNDDNAPGFVDPEDNGWKGGRGR